MAVVVAAFRGSGWGGRGLELLDMVDDVSGVYLNSGDRF
jgi:hypothetical protein